MIPKTNPKSTSIQAAAVIGSPIAHSLSPSIFLFIAHRVQKTLDYRAREIASGELGAFIQEVRDRPDFVGFNVTLPHKESILKHLDQLAPEVQVIGAANVVHRQGSELKGYNTDVDGILRTLRRHQPFRAQTYWKNTLVVGAGGAAKAVAYALASTGAQCISFLNRNRERSEALVQTFSKSFPKTQFRSLTVDGLSGLPQPIDLFVNATPVGMSGKSLVQTSLFESIFGNDKVSPSESALAFDLVYSPENTAFCEWAKRRGIVSVSGLEMLVEQALHTWEIWFGCLPESKVDWTQALMEYLRHRPIFLTGFSGAGKSTVGAVLAKKLNWAFLDTDRLIEQSAGMPVSEIFSTQGEARFREIESQVIQANGFSPKTVIALGGGALQNPTVLSQTQKTGKLVFLKTKSSTLLKRLQSSPEPRPLLHPLGEQSIQALLSRREATYQKAGFQVETDDLSPSEIAEQIVKSIQLG